MPLARRVQGRTSGIINRRERFITKALYAFGSKSGGYAYMDVGGRAMQEQLPRMPEIIKPSLY